MKICTAVFLTVVLCSAPLSDGRAFLGDDFVTIERHYGAALNRYQLAPGLESSVHESTGYKVLVVYRGGRSSRETFSKLTGPPEFTPPEIAAFLRAHSAGMRWDRLGPAKAAEVWERAGALATYLARGEKTTLSFESTGNDVATDLAPDAEATAKADRASPGLTTGSLDLGWLELGYLITGKLQTSGLTLGQLTTGKLQTGKLQTGSLNEPARPVQSP